MKNIVEECDFGNVFIYIGYTSGLNFSSLKNLDGLQKIDYLNADRFVNESDKVLHLISAYLKRKYVKSWSVNKYGKPVSDKVYFNVSHCKGAVALAIGESDIGIDIENVRPVERSLTEYVSNQTELESISSDEDFFKVWTAKESLAKAEGTGLNKRLKEIPAFPFDGEKDYLNEKYFSRQVVKGEYIITVTQKNMPFTLKILKEQIK